MRFCTRIAALTTLWGALAFGADGGTPSTAVKPSASSRQRAKLPTTEKQREAVRREAEAMEKAGPPPRFRWNIPEPIGRVEVPELVEGMGTPVKLHAVRTRWKIPDAMAFMLREFKRAGLYIPPAGHITKLSSDPQLHAFDPQRRVGYSVIFQGNRDGTTTLILGEAHLAERKPSLGQYFAPVFPNAEGVIESKQEGSAVLAYATPASPGEVQRFYDEVLKAQGYAPAPVREQGTLKYRKGSQQLVITVRRNPTQTSAVVITQGAYVDDGLGAASP